MKEALDFDAINQAALAAFPAVLNRLLPRGKAMGRELVALNPSRPDRNLGIVQGQPISTADGAISPPATRAAIQLALWPISPMFLKARRRACSPKCSGSKPGGGAMDNPLDAFAPLTEAELADAARQVPQDLEADATKPTCPPLDAENGVLAAARLYGCKPDMLWRYETTEAETAFYVVRWNEGTARKSFSRFHGSTARAGNSAPGQTTARSTTCPPSPNNQTLRLSFARARRRRTRRR